MMGQIITEPRHAAHHVIGPSTGHQCWQVPFQTSEEVIQMKIEARPIEPLEMTGSGDASLSDWLTVAIAILGLGKALDTLLD